MNIPCAVYCWFESQKDKADESRASAAASGCLKKSVLMFCSKTQTRHSVMVFCDCWEEESWLCSRAY